MLQRIITGLGLVFVIFLALFYLNYYLFFIFSGLVFLIAAWEWFSFSQKNNFLIKIILLILLTSSMLIFGFCLGNPIFLGGLYLGVGVWLLNILLILWPQELALKNNFYLNISSFLILIPAWMGLVFLFKPFHPWALIYLILITALADTGAYFSGKFLGKHKLAPQISPKKTWEGALGGLLISGFLSSIFFEYFGNKASASFIQIFLISLGLVLLSIFGDLFESLLKRQHGIKDSGVILPGHGGVLDRIDSLIAVLPFFALLEFYGHFFN